jgi:putative redox protein
MGDGSMKPRILIGHSLGGSAVIQAAGRIESCELVVVIAAPYDPAHLTDVFVSKKPEIERTGRATVDIGGQSFTITKQFFEDLREHSMRQRIDELGLPLVVVHSPDDPVVAIDHGEQIFEAANQPKWFVSLDGADHLLSDERHAETVGHLIADAARLFLH